MSVAFPSGVAPVVLVQREREADSKALAAFFSRGKTVQAARFEVAKMAPDALRRLVEVCRQKTGHSYAVRDLLYSLWNGQATSLLELVALDWEVREDLITVMRAFGFEGRPHSFFYDELAGAFKEAGLFEWFTDAFKEAPSLS